MTFFDETIRVEMNTHGGVVLHIPHSARHLAVVISSTIGGKWAIAKDVPTPDPNGLWGNGYVDLFDTVAEACWTRMVKNQQGLVLEAKRRKHV